MGVAFCFEHCEVGVAGCSQWILCECHYEEMRDRD